MRCGVEMSLQGGSQAPERGGKLFKALTGGALLLVVLGAFAMLQRRSEYRTLAEETETLAIQTVGVIHATPEAGEEDLVLPGTMEAFVESPIYARTNGYLKKWYHDIGSRVQKGDLLADIDTPEVDQQLSQARADLAAKRAIVQSEEANVHRLEEMKSFQHIYAPFSGVITRRNTDIGMLINAGNTGSAEQLFFLAQTSPLRVYVRVPEIYANTIHAGLGGYLEVTQYPGKKIEGKVVRTAEAIDLATRTLNTEVDVPNRDGTLLPGGYAQVHLEVKVTGSRLQVPVNALLFRSEGLRAVVVDANHKIHLRQITVGRDYGTNLEVLQGLDPKDWIVLNPEDSLEEGQEVRVKEIAMNTAAPAPGKPQTPTPGSNK